MSFGDLRQSHRREFDAKIFCNFIGTMQPVALDFGADESHDEVSGLARQYVNCILADRHMRSSEPSYDTLRLKGETVRVVKDTLAICEGEISPSVIFAVSLLACGCVSIPPHRPRLR